MKKFFVLALLLYCLLSAACAAPPLDTSCLTPEQIEQLRAEYPFYFQNSSILLTDEVTVERALRLVDCIAIVEITSQEEKAVHDVALPGDLLEKLGEDAAASTRKAFGTYAHFTLKVEKVLWRNPPNPVDKEREETTAQDNEEIVDGKEYTTIKSAYPELPAVVREPGTRLVLPLSWGTRYSAFEHSLNFSMNFAYYLMPDEYLLSFSPDPACEAYTGAKLEVLIADVKKQMDAMYADFDGFWQRYWDDYNQDTAE